MAKHIIPFILIFIQLNNIQCQTNSSIYYDALFLKQSCLDGDGFFQHKNALNQIFKRYYGGTNFDINSSLYKPILKANPFYGKYFSDGEIQSPMDRIEPKISPINFSTLGNLDVTTIADGFAKFIVNRTKKELQASFFDRFVKEFENEEYQDVKTLFPVTFNLIKQLPKEVYHYDKYLQSFRDAFGKDMESILPHLEDVIKNGKYEEFFNNHLELKSVCLTALYYGKGLQRGTHIGKLIEDYKPDNQDYQWSSDHANVIKTNAIRFMQEVSGSFRTATPGSKEYWVPADSIMLLASDEVAFNIYLGLLYQKVQDLKLSKTETNTYGTVMASMVNNVNPLKSLVENISDQINNVQFQIQNLQEKEKKYRSLDDYIAYFNSATRVIESFKENEFIKYISLQATPETKLELELFWEKYNDMIDASNSVLSIYSGLKEKNYSIAISNVRKLYQMRFEPGKAINEDVKSKVETILQFLLDKGLFIASVAQAKTSEEVYEAINMVALPSGSSRVKRLSRFNISVNAYCGLFTGYERIHDFDTGKASFNNFGLTAPIGFSISAGGSAWPWVAPWPEVKGWSSSIFISMVDLGAVAAFRFSDDTADQVPTIQLRDIFSPGVFWSLGFPNCPLSLNFGLQLGPNLRKVNVASNEFSNNTYTRYSISLVVDLPLLNLYTRSW